MTTAQAFEKLVSNIVLDNDEQLSNRYKAITKKLNQGFDRYLDLYNTIDSRHLGSESRLYRRRMAAETHLVSFTPFVWKSIEDGISVELLSDFFCHFYNGVDGASICEEYNMSCKAGSAKAAAIAIRNQMLQEEWNSFFSEG